LRVREAGEEALGLLLVGGAGGAVRSGGAEEGGCRAAGFYGVRGGFEDVVEFLEGEVARVGLAEFEAGVGDGEEAGEFFEDARVFGEFEEVFGGEGAGEFGEVEVGGDEGVEEGGGGGRGRG